MRGLHLRVSGYLPAAAALGLTVLRLPDATDQYVLPRASIVVVAACLGVGFAVLIPDRPRLGALRLPLLAAAAAAVLAFAFSTSMPLSIAGSFLRYETLPIRLSYLGLLAATFWLLRSQRQRDWLIACFVAGTSIECIKAWLQYAQHVPYRPNGDLGNANLLAALIVMALPLAIHRAWRAGILAVAWGGAIVLLATGLYLTTSRSAFAGAGAGCLALLVLVVPRRWGRIVAGVSAALILLGLLVILASPLRGLNGDPPELRLHLWSDGLRMIAARPITGYGEDTTGLNLGHFLSADYVHGVTFDRIHSGPLDVAAAQGVLGLAALGWVLVVLSRGAWARRSERDLGGLAGALVGYTVWVIPNFDWVSATGAFWLLAGALWSATWSAPDGERPEPARVNGLSWRVPAAAAFVIAAVVFGAFPLVADLLNSRGRPDLSVKLDPLQAQYYWEINTVPALRRAAYLGETDPAMYVDLGDQELQLGDRTAARRAYQQALQIVPYDQEAAQRLTEMGP